MELKEARLRKKAQERRFIMNNTRFNQNGRVSALVIAVMFIAGVVAIGCTANNQTPADQTRGGAAITDTSGVSKRVYSVSGVVSLNESSVEGLKISAFSFKKSSGPIHPKTAHTDANGAYRLDDLEPGEYHISMSAPEEVERDGRTMTIHRPVLYLERW